jgi:uncharacterized protein
MESFEKNIKDIQGEVEKIFNLESSGHDIFHLKRVLSLAMLIQKKEGGDKTVIAVAAFLHDIHRIIQNETGKYCSPKESLPKVLDILKKTDLSDEKVKRICSCIEFHEEYDFTKTGKTVYDIETLVVQDADNLDAMGAVGIARLFSYGGAHNISIWKPDVSLSSGDWEEASSYKSASQIHHIYEKLLKLKDNMNTKTAKNIALKRHKFMKEFLKEFFKEWAGKQ